MEETKLAVAKMQQEVSATISQEKVIEYNVSFEVEKKRLLEIARQKTIRTRRIYERNLWIR